MPRIGDFSRRDVKKLLGIFDLSFRFLRKVFANENTDHRELIDVREERTIEFRDLKIAPRILRKLRFKAQYMIW